MPDYIPIHTGKRFALRPLPPSFKFCSAHQSLPPFTLRAMLYKDKVYVGFPWNTWNFQKEYYKQRGSFYQRRGGHKQCPWSKVARYEKQIFR
jgi:hypothetical protein